MCFTQYASKFGKLSSGHRTENDQISFQFTKKLWRFLKKLEIELPYHPAIPLLGIHTEETRSERDTCTTVFIAALFIIARTWKQPRCPSGDEWIRKLWYIYTMEYYCIFGGHY